MNPFRRAWRWLKGGLRDVFNDGPRRKPNRGPCGCGHRWNMHSQAGCLHANDDGSACACDLNRAGRIPKRKLVVVKESA